MKKTLRSLILAGAMLCLPAAVSADKVMSPISGWEQSFWQYAAGSTGLTEGATGVEATGDTSWVQTGMGALHVWCEKSIANLNSQAVQTVSGLEEGKEYMLSGKLYISSSSWGFGLYLGDTRLTMLRNIVDYGQWDDFEYTFEFTAASRDLKLQVAQIGELYADDLSLKEVIRDAGGSITGYGAEMLKNGGFEEDFSPADDVVNLKADAYSNTAELYWAIPDDESIDKIAIFDGEELIEEVASICNSVIIDSLENGREYTFTVKTKTIKGVYSKGVSVSVTPVKRLDKPKIIKDDEDNRIVGLTEEMEYSLDEGGMWTRFDGAVYPELDGEVEVWIRIYTDEAGTVAPVQVLYFTENKKSNDDIEVTRSEINENLYTIEGVLSEKTAAKVTLLLVKKDADRRKLESILAIGQTTSNADGRFAITAKLADMRNGAVNDGEYAVYVDSTVTDEVSPGTVVFVNSEDRKIAFEALWAASDMAELFDEANPDYNAYIAMGFPVQDYNSRSDIKADVIADFAKLLEGTDSSVGREMAVKLFTQALVMNVLENTDQTGAYEAIKKYNGILSLRHNETSWAELLENTPAAITEICEYMAGREYSTPEDISKNFGGGYGLYLINDATYGEISGIIEQYENELGLSGTAYEQYKALADNSTKKVNVDKSIVLAKSKSPFSSGADVVNAIKNALEKNKETSTGTGGGDSGGGSSSSASSFSFTPSENIPKATQVKSSFSDLQNAGWAETAIEYLYEKGIISGYGDGSFAPGRTITREEFVSILVRAFGIQADDYNISFDDTREENWYYNAVITAANAGIVSGVGNGLFGVNQNITRQDLAVMLYRCIAPSESTELDKGGFTDMNEVSGYALEAVSFMKSCGYITGYADGSFKPMQTATRAEVAQILYSILS